MAREMARSICQRFLEARFIESCEGKTDFLSRGSVWQLTPKGMRVLSRFCSRNGIHQRHVNELLDSPRNMMQLVILEREPETDKLNHDRAIVEVVFRRFVGESGPNVKVSSSASDEGSLNEYATGLVGVRMIKSRQPQDRENPYVFNGKSAIDWLLDCCMVIDRRECLELANLFVAHELIAPVMNERVPEERHHPHQSRFQPVKTAHYFVTAKGMRLAGWVRSPTQSISGEAAMIQVKLPPGVARDSNTNRMTIIIRDPALRLLFREFLQETHCEENLTFYLEVKNFLLEYGVAKRSQPPRLDLIRETLASAYSKSLPMSSDGVQPNHFPGLYNAFLAPGSPCELNIDHNLRNALAGRMTKAVGEDTEMQSSLDEVAVLFDQAQTSVFKLMASVRLLNISIKFTSTDLSLGLCTEVRQGSKVRHCPSGPQPRAHPSRRSSVNAHSIPSII